MKVIYLAAHVREVKKVRMFLFSILVAAAVLLGNKPAQAQEVCPGTMPPTIAALADCVNHAIAVGHIDNVGIGNSLLSKLDAAQSAQDRNRISVAISLLEAFIHEVETQAARHIDGAHAAHMVEHAGEVIAALGG